MFDYDVIIPAHNEAARIAMAIESVLAQSERPRKLVVVDDGSNDGTGLVASRYPHVQVITHRHCMGLPEARNSGIAECQAEWIAFLDADDYWDPRKIEEQTKVAAVSGAGLVYCGVRVRRDGAVQLVECPATAWDDHRVMSRRLLLSNCITGSGSAVMVRRELLERTGGFDPAMKVAEDWDMWIRLSQVTTFAAAKALLVNLRVRAGSLGGSPERMFEGEWIVLRKNDHLFERFWDACLLRRKAEAKLFERRGKAYFDQGQLDLARKDLTRSLALWPIKMRSFVPLGKMVLGLGSPGFRENGLDA